MFAEMFDIPLDQELNSDVNPETPADFGMVITYVPESESLFWRRLAVLGWTLTLVLAATLACVLAYLPLLITLFPT